MAGNAPTIFRIVSLAFMAVSALDARGAQPADVTGVWLSPKANMRVRIAPCGSVLCGNIVWMKDPNNPQTGEPLTDRNNPDPGKRNRPILGMQMINDLKPGRAAGEWTAQVYSPNEGNTSHVSLSMDGPNSIKIEGCIIIGLVCRTQTWTRVN